MAQRGVFDFTSPQRCGGLEVTVVDENWSPIPDVLVVAWKSGECFTRAYTDANGVAHLPLDPMTAGTLTLTASKRNCIPACQDVAVQAFVPVYASLDNAPLDDATGGNDLINPGELVHMPIVLRNYASGQGAQTAVNVAPTLTSYDPRLTVQTTSALAYNDIVPLGTSAPVNSVAFQLRAGPDLQELDLVELTLVVYLTGSYHSTSNSPSFAMAVN